MSFGVGSMTTNHTHYVDGGNRLIVYRGAKRTAAVFAAMEISKRAKPVELRRIIGVRLRVARESVTENAAEFARMTEITPQQLNHYEQGTRFPDEAFVVKFCDLTGCPADWLYRGRMEAQMRPHMAAFIAAHAPELVPGLAADSVASAAGSGTVVQAFAADAGKTHHVRKRRRVGA